MEMRLWQSILACGLSLWLCLLVSSPLRAQSFDSQYDEYFKESSLRYLYGYLPDDDWRWFKAQCFQESLLNPLAVSPANARGICQITSGAAADSGLDDPFHAEKNIRAGAWILRRNYRVWWPDERSRFQRSQLAWASYNAGAGWIIRAQRRCGGARYWPEIVPCLGYITGYEHSMETVRYVAIIPTWYQAIVNE